MKLQYYLPTKIVFGRGSISRLSELLLEYSDKDTVLIVSGKNAAKKHGYLDRIGGYSEKAGWNTLVFDEVSPNPKSKEINKAIKKIRKKDGKIICDLIIGLGGGSAIDAAKAISAGLYYNSIEEIIGKTVTQARLPVIAIPMTAGSGAEVTQGAIITDTKIKLKSGIRGTALFPKVAIVDPELMLTLPTKVTAETGFDALTHAIESYVAKKANIITDLYAEKAIKLIAYNLERTIKDGSDIDARERMSLAALFGGMNIANASSCLPHRLQQAMGSIVDCSHGGGLAAVYPSWVRHAYPYAKEKFDNIAKILGNDDFEKGLIDFMKRIGVDYKLKDLGIQKKQIKKFVNKVSGNLENDPMPLEIIDKKLMTKIYEDSF